MASTSESSENRGALGGLWLLMCDACGLARNVLRAIAALVGRTFDPRRHVRTAGLKFTIRNTKATYYLPEWVLCISRGNLQMSVCDHEISPYG